MSRPVMTVLAVVVIAGAAACSGGGGNNGTFPAEATPACPLFAQLAETGKTVAHADVTDPDHFDATLKTAVTDYVRIARRLQVVVPFRLRSDVARVEAAAQQYRFDDAASARAALDAYARSECTTKSKSKSSS